jgi:hypothetical protein
MPMFSLIFSPKRGGAGHSKSSNDSGSAPKSVRSFITPIPSWAFSVLLILVFLPGPAEGLSGTRGASSAISAEAAARCAHKLQSLEDFSAGNTKKSTQTTQFSEEEVNSYLALNLSDSYHPSLQKLTMTFRKSRISAEAVIDFDRLGEISTGMMPKLINLMFSGVRTLTADGELSSSQGKAHFNLEQARFDDRTIPNYLVNEIIALVGKTQTPPFDPTKPSELPHKIDRVEIRPGFITVYQ